MAAELAALIAAYGYAATFVGTLLEGETFLLLSGVAAYRGYLSLPLLYAIGAAGAMLTDGSFFALGRMLGPALLRRFPRLAPAVARADALVARLPNSAVIGLRFLYGMRSVGPAVIGAGSMPGSRFLVLDVVAALLWSVAWVSAGYVLGEAAEQLLATVGPLGRWLVGGVLAAVAVASFVYLRRRRVAAPTRSKKV